MRLHPRARAAALAFLAAGITLLAQVLVHRVVSAKLLNNYAFLVISLTMLGFAFSGVFLSRALGAFLASFDDAMAACAALFSLSLLGVSWVFYRAPVGFEMTGLRPQFVASLLQALPLSLLYALPFACTGLMLGALLSAPALPTRRVYCFDLVGSALGAWAVIPLLRLVGVEAALVAAAALLLGGTLLLAPPQRRAVRVLAGIAAAVVLVAALRPDVMFRLRFPEGSMLYRTQLPDSRARVEYIAWDPLARVELTSIAPPDPKDNPYPALLGDNPAFLQRFRKILTQNNFAFTYCVDYDGHPESLDGVQDTIYAAAYAATSVARPKVAVVGVGGGFDVLTAIHAGASDITGIEINGATVDILTRTYRDYFGPWVRDPRVHLVNDEGRHYLSTRGDRFDVIQLSGVDSYSGTPGAAHVFSENYLYTSEAFDLYLSRLTDDGILNMMRLEFTPPREMLRALATAVGALRRAGVANPVKHVIMLSQKNRGFTALLVKKTPFTPEEERRVTAWAAKSKFFDLTVSPLLRYKGFNEYQFFLSLPEYFADPYFQSYAFDVQPVDDDRPFFFRYSFWWHVFPSDPQIWGTVPAMEYSVLLLLVLISGAALVCIYLPLRHFSKGGVRPPSAGRYGVFFASTGIGYLAIEMALLQKFGLFLGHPNYALSVVLAALLLTTGLGSLASSEIVRALGGVRFVSYVLSALILAEWALALPRLPGGLGLPFALRVAVVVALVAPLGLLLGTYFPSALEQLKPAAPDFVTWAWGINGIFSVLAPVLSVAMSLTWGINALLLSAVPVYLLAGLVLPVVPSPAQGGAGA